MPPDPISVFPLFVRDQVFPPTPGTVQTLEGGLTAAVGQGAVAVSVSSAAVAAQVVEPLLIEAET